MSWISKLVDERFKYSYSPACIVYTRDPRYVLFKLISAFSSTSTVLVYIPYTLYSVKRSGESIVLEPVSSTTSTPLPQVPIALLQQQSITSPSAAFTVFERLVEKNCTAPADSRRPVVLIVLAFSDLDDVVRTCKLKIVEYCVDPMNKMFKGDGYLIVVTDAYTSAFNNVHDIAIVVHGEPLDSDVEMLVDKLIEKLKRYGIDISRHRKSIINNVRGLEFRDIENILYKLGEKIKETNGKIDIVHELIKMKFNILQQYEWIEPILPKYGFEAVGGYEELKRYIKISFINVWKHRDIAEKIGAELPRGLLLFGLPGTGKTWFVKCMAKELDMPIFKLDIEMLMSRWYGETEKNIRLMFRTLRRLAPIAVFIDEVDRIMSERGTLQEHEVSRRVKNIILEEMSTNDDIVYIFATNFPEQLDEAFIRAGRIDIRAPFPLPDYDARIHIFKVHTQIVRKVPLAEDVDAREIARRTEGWTGAEIELLVKEACKICLNEVVERNGKNIDIRKVRVEARHFEEAFKNIEIDLEKREERYRRFLESARKLSSSRILIHHLEKKIVKLGDKIDRL